MLWVVVMHEKAVQITKEILHTGLHDVGQDVDVLVMLEGGLRGYIAKKKPFICERN